MTIVQVRTYKNNLYRKSDDVAHQYSLRARQEVAPSRLPLQIKLDVHVTA
jgi:hypothetical protein